LGGVTYGNHWKAAMLERKIVNLIGDQELLRMPVDASVAEAAQRMAKHHVGAMLVCEGDRMCGIITDRDVLERVVASGLPPGEIGLGEVMTPDPVSIAPSATALQAIFAMKAQMTRHLLVKDGDRVVGIISVRDLLRSVVDESFTERKQFEDLWQGFPV